MLTTNIISTMADMQTWIAYLVFMFMGVGLANSSRGRYEDLMLEEMGNNNMPRQAAFRRRAKEQNERDYHHWMRSLILISLLIELVGALALISAKVFYLLGHKAAEKMGPFVCFLIIVFMGHIFLARAYKKESDLIFNKFQPWRYCFVPVSFKWLL